MEIGSMRILQKTQSCFSLTHSVFNSSLWKGVTEHHTDARRYTVLARLDVLMTSDARARAMSAAMVSRVREDTRGGDGRRSELAVPQLNTHIRSDATITIDKSSTYND